jgi:L-glyceraldehyde 3-phosphate reductase
LKRAKIPNSLLREEELAPEVLQVVRQLHEHATERGQSLTQMALAWILRDPRVTSIVAGASRPEHIRQNCEALKNLEFTSEELNKIDEILAGLKLPPSCWASE